jgi:hypothetical protein
MAAALESGGAVVLIGYGQTAPGHEWAAATDEQRTALEYFSSADFKDAVAGHLGWIRDSRLLRKPTWVNTGLTDLEMICLKGPSAIIAEYKGEFRLSEALGPERTGRLGAAIAAVGFRAMSLPQRLAVPGTTARQPAGTTPADPPSFKSASVAGIARCPADMERTTASETKGCRRSASCHRAARHCLRLVRPSGRTARQRDLPRRVLARVKPCPDRGRHLLADAFPVTGRCPGRHAAVWPRCESCRGLMAAERRQRG